MAYPQRAAEKPSPAPIMEATFAFGHTRVLAAAVELDVFTRIQRGGHTLEKLAGETQCSSRGLRILLGALTGLGYLVKENSGYTLTPLSATYLSKTSPAYLGGLVLHSAQISSHWDTLAHAVRTGQPVRSPVENDGDRGEFFSRFVDSLYALNAAAADTVAQSLLTSGLPAGSTVLDVGAGSGVWSIAFAKRDSQVRVTVADWPVVIEKVTKPITDREGVAKRYEYLPGNFRDADFGESRFNVAILGHICHSEGAERTKELLGRVHRALKPGGYVVIADFLPDEARREATFPLLFAVNMLVNTEEGDTFSLAEYRQWLTGAGYTDVRTLDSPSASPLVLARKK